MSRETPLHAEDIANYLDKNRTFFHVFPNLLDELSLPHPKSGKAVSLLERQVYQLREQRDGLQIEVDGLMEVAGENSQLFQKVQTFTKALMATQTDQQAVDCIYDTLRELFEVDYLSLVTWDVPKISLRGVSQLGVSQTWSETLKGRMRVQQPACGLLEKEWQNGPFHTQDAITSVCVLPLGDQKVWGVLALGSQTDRFHPSLGTYFLKMMAELVTAKLNHLF